MSGFKAHLKLKNNRFELLDRNLISNDGSEIETLFVERIAQLLKPQGIAAVILPSSILSNDSNSYIKAREILLNNFSLRAVAQFGGKTFGATGTNTVVLFLEKYNEPPKQCEIVKDIVNAILSGDFADDWEDVEVFGNYTRKIGVPDDLYKIFAKETATKDNLLQNEYFAQYVSWFDNLTEIQNKRKNVKFQRMSDDEQAKEIRDLFFKKVKEVEYDKLTYFALIYKQTTLTIIAPADNAEQKKFLGYDWSNRKGAEGIQINQPGGMLYNDGNRYVNDTLAAAVRNSFSARTISLPATLDNFMSYLNTQDMIVFSRTTFNKAIKLTIDKKIEIVSKYPLVKLSSVVDILSGGTPSTKNPEYWNGNIPWLSVADFNKYDRFVYSAEKSISKLGLEKSNTQLLQINDLIISARGTVGALAQIGTPMAFNQSCYGLRGHSNIDNGYLYYCLTEEVSQLQANATGTKFPAIVRDTFDFIKIPLPPIDVQRQIVSECEKVDEEYNNNRMSIEEYKKKIAEVFENLDVISKRGG